MSTTKRHRHTHGVLPLKAPPWFHNHHHQCVLSLLLIIYYTFLHQQTPSSFITRFFNSINNSPPLFSPPLLLDPTLFSTDSTIKITNPIPHPLRIYSTPLFHPIGLPLLSYLPPTTTLPSSGTHLHVPPTPLSTQTTYQFPRTSGYILLQPRQCETVTTNHAYT